MARCAICHRRLPVRGACAQHGAAAAAAAAAGAAAATLSDPAAGVDPGPPPGLAGFTIAGKAPLGRGGFATVWAATRDRDGAAVAIKVGHTASALIDARTQREADALQSIGPPTVPMFLQSGRLDDGRSYVAMERLDGRTLAEHLVAHVEPPPLPWVRAVADAVLVALAGVHARGLVHRDLKPENVFLDDAAVPTATLVDFGLVKQVEPVAPVEPDLTRAGTIVGTVEYMAPEQLGAPDGAALVIADQRADLYAFGVLLYELVTLRPPFVGPVAAIEHGHRALRPPRPSTLSVVPEALEALILACLAKEPARRPPDAGAIRAALHEAFTMSAPAAPANPSRRPSLLGDTRQPAVVLAVAADHDALELAELVASHRGVLARTRGARSLFVFTSLAVDDPVRQALEAARELGARHDAPVALHLASLSVRALEGGRWAIHGPAVDRPETWWPAEAWTGLVVTRAIAAAAPDLGGAPHPLFTELLVPEAQGPSEPEPPLLARAPLLAAAAASLEDVVAAASPGLFTVIGAPGLGKSRLARELARLAHATARDAEVVTLAAARRDAEVDGNLARLAAALGVPVTPAPSAADVVRALWTRAARGPLVVIVDDAHLAEEPLIEALEAASLDEPAATLWIVVLARPALEEARARWGARARAHRRVVLAPLDEQAGRRLAAISLLPAEYVPDDVLGRLHAWAGGNPFFLRELARTLKRTGIVKPTPEGDGWFLATPELDRLPSSPVGQWFAARELDALPPELAALARLAAVLGVEFSERELEHVQEGLEREGGAGTSADVRAGLAQLERRGLIVRGHRWSFRTAIVRDAIYQLLASHDRVAVHAHALAFWRGALGAGPRLAALEPFARHAVAAGHAAASAAAYVELAEEAHARHRWVEAHEHASAALDALDALGAPGTPGALADAGGAAAPGQLLARAHFNRARARYHLHRVAEALGDLALAKRLAADAGDDALLVDAMLEEATALDWAEDYPASAAVAAALAPRAAALGDPARSRRARMAEARARWRRGELADAIRAFEAIADDPDVDHETRVVTLLMLGPSLVGVGRLDDARVRFDDVIERCTVADDRLHLCTAYANRLFLWAAREEIERGRDDLRRAIALARSIGNPWLERTATLNLAEILHWSGDLDEALRLAARARSIHERFSERAILEDALLVARVHAARGELAAAQELVTFMRTRCPPPPAESNHAYLLAMVELAADPDRRDRDARWVRLLDEARPRLALEELLELVHWRATDLIHAGEPDRARQVLDEAQPLLRERSIWATRFAQVDPTRGP